MILPTETTFAQPGHVVEWFMDLEQYSPEWWKLRQATVTGSTADPLLASAAKGWAGLSSGAWTLVYQLADELRLGDDWDPPSSGSSYQSDDMERGHLMEPKARKAYELVQLCRTQLVGFVRVAGRLAGASPDFRQTRRPIGGEIKCLSWKHHVAYCERAVPDLAHQRQVQWSLWVTKWKRWDLVHYHPEAGQHSLKVDPTEPDPKAQKAIDERFQVAEKAIRSFAEKYSH